MIIDASKILCVTLTAAVQVTDQLKWLVMLLFKCCDGFHFPDGMLCSFHLVSQFATSHSLCFLWYGGCKNVSLHERN